SRARGPPFAVLSARAEGKPRARTYRAREAARGFARGLMSARAEGPKATYARTSTARRARVCARADITVRNRARGYARAGIRPRAQTPSREERTRLRAAVRARGTRSAPAPGARDRAERS